MRGLLGVQIPLPLKQHNRRCGGISQKGGAPSAHVPICSHGEPQPPSSLGQVEPCWGCWQGLAASGLAVHATHGKLLGKDWQTCSSLLYSWWKLEIKMKIVIPCLQYRDLSVLAHAVHA